MSAQSVTGAPKEKTIALFDGTCWFTPASPLLKGTKREYYLDNKMIFKCDIAPADLSKYKKMRLINAMLDLDDGVDIPIENILCQELL